MVSAFFERSHGVAFDQLSLEEAQLFRQLTALFGKDAVIPNMSLKSVILDSYEDNSGQKEPPISEKSGIIKCLFTIVDANDKPCLVVEFAATDDDVVDLTRLERAQELEPVLLAHEIRFITLSRAEFNETMDPSSGVKFVTLLQGKLDDIDTDWGCIESGD